MYLQGSSGEPHIGNRIMDTWGGKEEEGKMYRTSLSMGEGEGGMFRANSIKTCVLSRVKEITSPGWMHETSARSEEHTSELQSPQ